MDVDIFVKNLKAILKERGITPATAGRESGCGQAFIPNMEHKGTSPSVAKVQQMAQYLGMTTSELLGEKKSGPAAGAGIETAMGEEAVPSSEDWAAAFSELSTEDLLQVQEILLKEFGQRIKDS